MHAYCIANLIARRKEGTLQSSWNSQFGIEFATRLVVHKEALEMALIDVSTRSFKMKEERGKETGRRRARKEKAKQGRQTAFVVTTLIPQGMAQTRIEFNMNIQTGRQSGVYQHSTRKKGCLLWEKCKSACCSMSASILQSVTYPRTHMLKEVMNLHPFRCWRLPTCPMKSGQKPRSNAFLKGHQERGQVKYSFANIKCLCDLWSEKRPKRNEHFCKNDSNTKQDSPISDNSPRRWHFHLSPSRTRAYETSQRQGRP